MIVPALGLVVLAGAIVLGATGFGFGLLSLPLLSLLYDPHEAVVMSLLFAFVILLIMLLRAEERRCIRYSLVLPLFGFSLVGLPLGVYVLTSVNTQQLRIMVSVLVLAFSLINLVGISRPLQRSVPVLALVGFVSGFLSTSTSLSGAPVALFAAGAQMPKSDFRASMAAYGFLSIGLSLVLLAIAGAVSTETLRLSATLLPILLLGYWLGASVFRRLSSPGFNRLVLVVIAGTGAASLLTTLRY
ncbi:MAG TPA: sulfite exporter TauE/SafE family protein [Chloroflexota bacterium]